MRQGQMYRRGWLSSLSREYIFAASIQELTQFPQDDYGKRIGEWSTVPGLEEIPAKMAVAMVNAGNRERAELDQIDRIDRLRHISLTGYWPQITERHRVLVSLLDPLVVGQADVGGDVLVAGQVWTLTIVTVQHDSHQQATRIMATMQEAA